MSDYFSSSGFPTPQSSDDGTSETTYWQQTNSKRLNGLRDQITWTVSIDGSVAVGGPEKQKLEKILEKGWNDSIRVLEGKSDELSCCELKVQEIQELKTENEELKTENERYLEETNLLKVENALKLENRVSKRQQAAVNRVQRVWGQLKRKTMDAAKDSEIIEALDNAVEELKRPDDYSCCVSKVRAFQKMKAENQETSHEIFESRAEEVQRLKAENEETTHELFELMADEILKLKAENEGNLHGIRELKAEEIQELKADLRNAGEICEEKEREIRKLKRDNFSNMEKMCLLNLEVQSLKANVRMQELKKEREASLHRLNSHEKQETSKKTSGFLHSGKEGKESKGEKPKPATRVDSATRSCELQEKIIAQCFGFAILTLIWTVFVMMLIPADTLICTKSGFLAIAFLLGPVFLGASFIIDMQSQIADGHVL